MLTFTYTARDIRTGQKVKADIEAENERAAGQLLVTRGLAPLSIEVKPEKGGFGFMKKIPAKQRIIFSRQLSTLINAGLPLVQSLRTVEGQTSHAGMKNLIQRMVADIEGGASLSAALQKYPDVFDNVYINLVAAAEASGSLDKSLERLATQQEKDAEVLSKVRGAMVYPIIVLLVLFGIMIFMTTTILPQVSEVYKGIPGAKLPFVTQLMLSFSHFITHFWWLMVVALFGGLYSLRRFMKTEKGIKIKDQIKISAWPVAPLFMKLYMARFARTASTLVGSGVPMIKMLETTADAVGNVHIAGSIYKAAEQVKGGKTLSSSIENDPHFLDLVPGMISIGEQSGALEAMLGRVADYYEKEVDTQVKSINTIIEPLMMIVVGIVALIIVAAVLLPIYGLAGKNLG